MNHKRFRFHYNNIERINMKKIFIILIAFTFAFITTTENIAQKKSGSFGYKTKSFNTYRAPKTNYKSNTFKVPKLKSYTPKSYSLPKSTYKSGSTTYIMGENYKTTGMPKVKRNSGAKEKFLKSKGYKKVPQGYEVDHIIPLSKGGQDDPSNMQLIPKEMHKQKTANERKK